MAKGELLRFDDWMRQALYDAERGYYRQGRDPFGRRGDFFTASQMQPLFGRVIAAEAHMLAPGEPVWELGSGRGEMASYFGPTYTAIEQGDDLPPEISGLVFANEFFDALPVRAVARSGGTLYELVVRSEGERAQFERGPELDAASAAFAHRYWPHIPEGGRFEIGTEALAWIDRVAARMRHGRILIVDYGFTTAETIRFPQGTLMSYRNHSASPNVLADPGSQDITAHVAFDAIRDRAELHGFECVRLETLAALVIRNVERDPALVEGFKARQQLKTVMFGMGETFRCLLLQKRKGPDCSGPSRA